MKQNSELSLIGKTALFGGTALLLAASTAKADTERGFKLNNLTVSPYVNLEYRYDSNVDADKREFRDSIIRVTPGVDLNYKGNNWGIKGNAYYGYSQYMKYDELDSHRWGESLTGFWESDKGWKAVFGESYVRSKDSDSILSGGRGIWRDREQLTFDGALSYTTERTGVTLDGSYSYLDYKNSSKYQQLYGWSEWTAGLEFARKLTEKTNFLLAGGMQGYHSDNATRGVRNESTGYTIQAGVGSRASKRLTYRLLAGASWFDYANSDTMSGWAYSADVHWAFNKKWAFSLVGSSYFRPSETSANQASEVYSLAAGLTYRPFKKLTTRFDLAWRHEEEQRHSSYDEDILSARLRADYQLARYASVYAGVQYDNRWCDYSAYEYDRFIGLLGMRLFY